MPACLYATWSRSVQARLSRTRPASRESWDQTLASPKPTATHDATAVATIQGPCASRASKVRICRLMWTSLPQPPAPAPGLSCKANSDAAVAARKPRNGLWVPPTRHLVISWIFWDRRIVPTLSCRRRMLRRRRADDYVLLCVWLFAAASPVLKLDLLQPTTLLDERCFRTGQLASTVSVPPPLAVALLCTIRFPAFCMPYVASWQC